jgi:hypothetical protein
MAINRVWHASHRLGSGAKLEDRIRWHIAHAKACACREMPASIRAAIRGRKTADSRRQRSRTARRADR